MNVKNELTHSAAKPSKSDPAVFTWHFDNKSSSILCTYVDDFLIGGNEIFINNVIEPLKSIFTKGSELCTTFKYLSLNISQSDKEFILYQNDYINSIKYISLYNKRKKIKIKH